MRKGDTPADKIREGEGGFDKSHQGPWIAVLLYPVPDQYAEKEWYQYLRHDHHANNADNGDRRDGTQGRVFGKYQYA